MHRVGRAVCRERMDKRQAIRAEADVRAERCNRLRMVRLPFALFGRRHQE